jgi:hypothetical protein
VNVEVDFRGHVVAEYQFRQQVKKSGVKESNTDGREQILASIDCRPSRILHRIEAEESLSTDRKAAVNSATPELLDS